jgi:hypothetical protein
MNAHTRRGRSWSHAVAIAASCALVAVAGCSADNDPLFPHACPGGCIQAAFATFELSCSPNDLIGVTASGPCAMPDAGLSFYTGSASQSSVSIESHAPGTCHVVLTFATGFTYEADVGFTSHSIPSEPGCGQCPDYIGPTSGPFQVNNPSDTCVGVTDAASPADAGASTEAGAGDP